MANTIETFWSRVDIKSEDECWNWTWGKHKEGYGRFKYQNKEFQTHRFSYLISYGNLDPNLLVCHKCDNPSCVNPKHLFLGTFKDNAQDRSNKGRCGRKGAIGESSGVSKLTELQVLEIRTLYNEGFGGYKKLGKKFGVHHSNIESIVKKNTWRHI
jgi:hypothetical protein